MLKHEPSAQIPRQNTMLGLDFVDTDATVILLIFILRLTYRASALPDSERCLVRVTHPT